jgi:hypothetical protein
MVESEAYFIKTIDIPCELDNINFEAREIGFYTNLYEKETETKLREYFLYFIEYSEKGLEKANERLKRFREKLASYGEQQREF